MSRSKKATIALIAGVTLTTGLIALAAISSGTNHSPHVSNVVGQQREGTELVDIFYDVEDQDGDSLTISVRLSDNGGLTFLPAYSFSGDIGAGISPGVGKSIVWNGR